MEKLGAFIFHLLGLYYNHKRVFEQGGNIGGGKKTFTPSLDSELFLPWNVGQGFLFRKMVGLPGEINPLSSDARYPPTIKTVGFLARKFIIEKIKYFE
jgi:hypothetical protein